MGETCYSESFSLFDYLFSGFAERCLRYALIKPISLPLREGGPLAVDEYGNVKKSAVKKLTKYFKD